MNSRNLRDPLRHLIFDNSLTPASYRESQVEVVGPSWLEAVDGRLPVAAEPCVSPPNSLRLAWRSEPGGDWQARIRVMRWRGRAHRLAGDVLSFWCYSEAHTEGHQLPQLSLRLRDGARTPPLRLKDVIERLPATEWVQVQVPWSRFGHTMGPLDFAYLREVIFEQSVDDGTPHVLYLDEIKVLPTTALPARAPTGLSATGHDHHVDLHWAPAENAQYYIIYRARDGHPFRPVGTQHAALTRFADWTGPQRGAYEYRVTARGYDCTESAPSETVSATTRPYTDEALLTMVQEACFRYYWEGAHPQAGLALESIPGDENLVALGASGFGILALLVGAARGFISRRAARERMERVLDFLERADRYHGAWSHFMDGRSGRTIPYFGPYDDGGDLVETAFMVQGLLTARQYFDLPEEGGIRARLTRLWETVEWDWYRPPGSDFLLWHWSPTHEWHIDHPLIGWNETLIAYLLAIASPTHPVPVEMWHSGWASPAERAQAYRQNWGKTTAGDLYVNGNRYYDLTLDVGVGTGGPLFFTHYSFLGFDPRGKRDRYTNYFRNNRTLALINQRYCAANPGEYEGYSERFWGLTASDDHRGYKAHDPTPRNDNGTITPTAALASFPYTPQESLAALKHFYYELGDRLWGSYGFRDAINLSEEYVSPIFMGLNQAPIVVMIENHRSGLLWELFMANPEIAAALERIGFVPDDESS